MSIFIKQALALPGNVINRTICCSAVLSIKEWRISRGLPENKMSSGPLTDKSDYTFLDGRPTPLLHKQKMRLMKQREFAEKIIELNKEIDFAVEREKSILHAKEEERKRFISDRLRPKGNELFKKST